MRERRTRPTPPDVFSATGKERSGETPAGGSFSKADTVKDEAEGFDKADSELAEVENELERSGLSTERREQLKLRQKKLKSERNWFLRLAQTKYGPWYAMLGPDQFEVVLKFKPQAMSQPPPPHQFSPGELKRTRENKGWTQDQMGRYLHLTGQSIGNLESGEVHISPKANDKLLKLYHLDDEDIAEVLELTAEEKAQAERIKNIRSDLNMTQFQLAAFLGVRKSRMSQLEAGLAVLTDKEQQKLDQLGGVSNPVPTLPPQFSDEDKARGAAIRQLRNQAGWTQTQFAQYLDVKRHTVALYEHGAKPSDKIQKKIDAFRLQLESGNLPELPGVTEEDRERGQDIQELRLAMGMNLVKFARLLGVDPGTVVGYENGRVRPSSKIQKMLDEFRKDPAGIIPAGPDELDVAQLREDLGWSQLKLAEYLQIHFETVGRYERGGKPSPEILKKLQALRASLSK